MKYYTSTIRVETRKREEIIDITSLVNEEIKKSRIKMGFCIIFSLHTTCGITINENADPDVKRDLVTHLKRVFPPGEDYHHLEGNSDAHLKVSTTGCSELVVIDNGALLLGTWQGIMLCEFDGPRHRSVLIRVQGE
ncbi:MAG: secondary thiamine-phosphate synthase enzyme YjbQ [Promethearchaeota archaeon]